MTGRGWLDSATLELAGEVVLRIDDGAGLVRLSPAIGPCTGAVAD